MRSYAVTTTPIERGNVSSKPDNLGEFHRPPSQEVRIDPEKAKQVLGEYRRKVAQEMGLDRSDLSRLIHGMIPVTFEAVNEMALAISKLSGKKVNASEFLDESDQSFLMAVDDEVNTKTPRRGNGADVSSNTADKGSEAVASHEKFRAQFQARLSKFKKGNTK